MNIRFHCVSVKKFFASVYSGNSKSFLYLVTIKEALKPFTANRKDTLYEILSALQLADEEIAGAIVEIVAAAATIKEALKPFTANRKDPGPQNEDHCLHQGFSWLRYFLYSGKCEYRELNTEVALRKKRVAQLYPQKLTGIILEAFAGDKELIARRDEAHPSPMVLTLE